LLYKTRNIAALARYLYKLRTSKTKDVQGHEQIINDLITKYSAFALATQPAHAKHIIALTRVTRELGTYLLA
jgi:hypothetical protein